MEIRSTTLSERPLQESEAPAIDGLDSRETRFLKLGDFSELELAFGPAGEFLGIAQAVVSGMSLRSPALPLSFEIRSSEALELCAYRVKSIETLKEGGFEIFLSAKVRSSGIMEWMLHEARNRVPIRDWSEPPKDSQDISLSLILRPVERSFLGAPARGFSYQVKYACESIPIYRILDRGTWEPGGSSTGCELWFRNSTAPSIVEFKGAGDFYSTEWYLPGIANPNIFQFQPFQTQFQGFTFTACSKGVLLTWATEPSHIRTLIEKPRGHARILHLHEHCGDLSQRFETSPMEVLWMPGPLDLTGRANLYDAARELTHGELHRKAGMRRERIATYGVIEEWIKPDLDAYVARGIPKLLDFGVKTIFLPNQFQNNMNVYGVANMCCTIDWKLCGEDEARKLKALCAAVAASGGHVEMWGNTALSTFGLKCWETNGRKSPRLDPLPREGSIAEVLAKAQDPFVRNPSGAIDADHYAPVFAVLNLLDPVIRSHWIECWRRLKEELGVGGIFLDSSFNLSSDKFHWTANPNGDGNGVTIDQVDMLGRFRPAREPAPFIKSQYHAHLSLMAEMQRMGYIYCGEDIGLFGLSRSGPSIKDRLGSLHLWQDTLCVFDVPEIESRGADPRDVFFMGLAFRMMWYIYWVPHLDTLSFRVDRIRGAYDVPGIGHSRLIKAFNAISGCMFHRTVLSGGRGVLYRNGAEGALWAFNDFLFSAGGMIGAENILDGDRFESDSFAASKNQVYSIRWKDAGELK